MLTHCLRRLILILISCLSSRHAIAYFAIEIRFTPYYAILLIDDYDMLSTTALIFRLRRQDYYDTHYDFL